MYVCTCTHVGARVCVYIRACICMSISIILFIILEINYKEYHWVRLGFTITLNLFMAYLILLMTFDDRGGAFCIK